MSTKHIRPHNGLHRKWAFMALLVSCLVAAVSAVLIGQNTPKAKAAEYSHLADVFPDKLEPYAGFEMDNGSHIFYLRGEGLGKYNTTLYGYCKSLGAEGPCIGKKWELLGILRDDPWASRYGWIVAHGYPTTNTIFGQTYTDAVAARITQDAIWCNQRASETGDPMWHPDGISTAGWNFYRAAYENADPNDTGALYNNIAALYMPPEGEKHRQEVVVVSTIPWGEISVHKTSTDTSISSSNSNLYKIAGAQYTLYSDQNCTIPVKNAAGTDTTFTIQENGNSDVVHTVPGGDYFLKETQAPTGFKMDPTVYAIHVPRADLVQAETADQPITGRIKVVKKDADTDEVVPLPGFKFALYAENGSTPLATATTDDSGTVTFNVDLPLGNYQVQELEAPSPYVVDSTRISISMRQQGSDGTIQGATESAAGSNIKSIIVVEKHDSKTTSATVKKVWNDNENASNSRPSSLSVALMKNGNEYKTVTLDDQNGWEYTEPDLDANFEWTWEEVDLPENYSFEGQDTEGTITTITNKLDIQPEGTGEIRVKKTLSGRAWKTGDSFEFTLTGSSGAPMPANTTLTITNADSGSNYTKSFGTINFTEAGTYTYTVKETHKGETINGVTYDSTDKTVTLAVVEQGGHLVASDGGSLIKTAKFTNTYASSGEGSISVKKVLSGRDWETDDSFEFTLTGSSGAPMPANTPLTITNADSANDYTKSFGTINFTKAGTYTYTVKETHKGETINGVKYDSTDKTVTIVVKDNGQGQLVAGTGSTLTPTATFTNSYSASSCQGEVRVKKTLSGRAWKTGDSFEFTLTGSSGAPMPANTTLTITNTDSGSYTKTKSFGTINFTAAGTYTYTVKETHKGETINGVKYDSTDKTVTIVVVEQNGKLVAGSGSNLVQTASFSNVYTANGTGSISVKKVLSGRDWKTGDSFEFTLTGSSGAPMPANTTLTITNADSANDYTKSFGTINFTAAGTYTYTVKETHKGETINGIIYDSTDKTVTIVVKDNGQGQLVAGSDSTLSPTATFTNVCPGIGTQLATVNGDKEFLIGTDMETITLVDTVSYRGLVPGTEYELHGELRAKDGSAQGTAIAGSGTTHKFTPDNSEGTVAIEMSVKTADLSDDIVAFEELYLGTTLITSHKDIGDSDQTVKPHVPELQTMFSDIDGNRLIGKGATTVTVVDHVQYENLIPGKEYELRGSVHIRKDGKDAGALDGVAPKKTFTPSTANGTETLEFTVDMSDFAGEAIVAFENLYQGDVELAIHADIHDENQTIEYEVPSIGTKLATTTGDKDAIVGIDITTIELIDTVSYSNVIPGSEYTMAGTLHAVTADGKDGGVIAGATGETTFKPDQASGTVEVRFTLDVTKLQGDSVVAFETLRLGDTTIAEHSDITDANQTVNFHRPSIGTTLMTTDGKKAIPAGTTGSVTLIDTVEYKDLVPGREYTLRGEIHTKNADGSDGGVIPGSAATIKLVPTSSSGKAEVKMTVSSASLGRTFVAFEELHLKVADQDKLIATHKDISDTKQSVTVARDTNLASQLIQTGGNVAITVIGIAMVGAVGMMWSRSRRKVS